jgi:DNA-binding MarR family transcriptional regulator
MARVTNLKVKESADELVAPELMFEELDGLLGYQLRRAQGAMHRDFVATVSGLDLTQKQAATLWLISANPGASQVSIAAALGIDRATMMAVTDRLQDRGFVRRTRSIVDRRRQELNVTPAGAGALRKIKSRIAEHEERARALLTAGELQGLLVALKKLQGII